MLKLQYFGHLMQRAESWKRPWCCWRLREGEGGGRGWDGWMASLTQWAWVWANFGRWWGQGSVACCSPWGRKVSDRTWQLNRHNNKITSTRFRLNFALQSWFAWSLQSEKKTRPTPQKQSCWMKVWRNDTYDWKQLFWIAFCVVKVPKSIKMDVVIKWIILYRFHLISKEMM